MSVVLGDLGGTNLRLSKDGGKTIETFLIADYPSFDGVLKNFAPEASELYLASAYTPLDGIIEDKRFADKAHWRIDVNALGVKTIVLNDLEAAAYGLSVLPDDQTKSLLKSTGPQRQFDQPPKLLIGIGTGIGHAFLFERAGQKPFVLRTHGGHVPAFAITKEQEDIVKRLRAKHSLDRDFIMENVIGGKGLWTLAEDIGKDAAISFFWEFLGLYTNMLVSVAGAYGGVYLCGGIMDDMVEEGTIDADGFEEFFRRPMVSSVTESLAATPVSYVADVNLPILGLSVYSKAQS
jgi:glucokinase